MARERTLLSRVEQEMLERAGRIVKARKATLDEIRFEQGYVDALNWVIELAQGRAASQEEED